MLKLNVPTTLPMPAPALPGQGFTPGQDSSIIGVLITVRKAGEKPVEY